ncbi:MAG: ThuA domain-containing protein [Candidatus Sumerlaeota bacterium]|nr:ThuA domain-containing protein [Candidatus Sumerlaeota bacterium]
MADETKPMQILAAFLRDEAKYDPQIIEPARLESNLAPYAAVFMYIHGPMDARVEKILADYARGGGRLVILHHGLASARMKNPEWLRLTGIRISPRDDPKTPWRVVSETTFSLVNLNPTHYITSHNVEYSGRVEYQSADTSGPAQFPVLDLPKTEIFLNQQFTDGREKTVLFGFRGVDPKTGELFMQDRGGWLKPTDRGWVFYLQAGHAESDFRNRNYCQIIWNCLTWKP